MAFDQAHEENNALIKGAIGLTENPSVLNQWMISGLQMACMVQLGLIKNLHHHEQTAETWLSFLNEMKSCTVKHVLSNHSRDTAKVAA